MIKAKTSFRLILSTLAATAALTACTKEITHPSFENDKVNPAAEGSRVIAVSFAPQTKTTLDKDGLTPNFVNGDKILVANGQDEPDTCVVSVNGGKATITTNLTGPLNAVYPAKAAKMNDSNLKQIDTVLVSAVQSGTFADANICMAKDITNEAVFENKTAVLRFYVDESIGVTSVKVTSQSEEITPNKGMEITVQTDGGTLFGLKGNIDQRICYVAIPSGQYTKLTLSSTANTQTPEPRELDNVTLNIGTMYNAFIPYYIQVGDQKWAYCNIGAFLPEEYGDFFVWGGTEGHRAKPSTASFEDSFSFYIGSFPESLDNGCSSYISKVCQNDILLPAHDAANVVWKGNWRMPTQEEAEQLVTLGSQYVDGKFKGWRISDTELFLPATGYGTNDYISFPGEAARYWTSSVKDSNSMYAWTLILSDTPSADVNVHEIYWGCPIRPIYAGPAPAPEKPTSLSGVFTVGEGKAVRFSRGNLYWDGTSSPGAYKFETEQYFYRHYPGKTDDVAFLGGGDFETTPVGTVGGFWWTKKGETAFYPYSESFDSSISISISTSDCLFTNGAQEQANSDFTVNGETGVWRTLSGGPDGEWKYLLEKRKDAAEKVGTATVNGVTGTILLPDTFTDPSVNNASVGGAFVPLDSIPEDMNFGDNIYDLDSWEKMESEGAVFLPAAGYGGYTRWVQDNQKLVYYWSSSVYANSGTVYSIYIKDGTKYDSENYGVWKYTAPVRLVTDAPVTGSTVDDLNVKDEDTDNWQ